MSETTGHRGHLSFSQLSTMASCGEMYRRKYIENEKTPDANLPALVGSAFHAAVEQFERREPLPYDSKDASALLTKETRKLLHQGMKNADVTESELIVFGKQDLKHWEGKGIPGLARQYLTARYEEDRSGFYFHNSLPIPPHEVEVAEQWVSPALIPLRGIIDQVMVDSASRIVLRDLKTGKPKPSHAMQLELYGYLYREQFDEEPAYGQLLYVSATSYKYEVVKFSLSQSDVALMLEQAKRAIQTDVFPVSGPFNGSCGYCDFKSSCAYSAVDTRGSS